MSLQVISQTPFQSERFHCTGCGETQGKESGNWYEYPTLLECASCGRDLADAFRDWIIEKATEIGRKHK